MKSYFTKHWDPENGFTIKEAMETKKSVDNAHAVGLPGSNWKASEILIDPKKKSGYMIAIETM